MYIGCYNDGFVRTLPTFHGPVSNPETCANLARINNADTYGLQNPDGEMGGGECWSCNGCNYTVNG